MQGPTGVTTFLFTDIEGSTRLWEETPEAMRQALASHDAIARTAVERNDGEVVKMSGDGIHAAFADPLQAVEACLQLLQAIAEVNVKSSVALRVRCGLHAGVDERRDGDFFGNAVNRAARIMRSAHGGQALVSQAVATLVRGRLPAGVSLRDLGAVRLRGLVDPERVYQLVHPELLQEFPALRSLETNPSNLPQQVTSFVGREATVLEVRSLLTTTRLLTLLGVGGIGKTRLALEVGGDSLNDHLDGVWLVELAPVGDGRLVPQAVASVLGVKEDPGRPVLEALARFVKDRLLLLILDNCEHLVQPCAEVTKSLLQSGPHLKILATSREQLHLAGETTFLVPALAAPESAHAIGSAHLTRYDAVRLFVERARAAQSSFVVTDTNAQAVADVCCHLDGIPLAIELAAARVRTLPVDAIAARLNDRFSLLAGRDMTVLPRQQTLRALIDWSHDLLSQGERILFRRLAVFAGGWTLEAAESVGAGGEVTDADALELLTRLIEKSLVTADVAHGRYGFLETVRQYALERLSQSGEETAARARHLAFFLALAEKARSELMKADQAAWLKRLDVEWENILSGHSWCDHAAGGGEAGMRLVHAVKSYCFNRGLLGLGHRLTVEALARDGASARGLARCKVLADAGQYSSFMGQYGQAREHLEQSLAIARELNDSQMIAHVLQPLALAALGQGESETAHRCLEEAIALARAQGDRRELAGAINALAQVHRIQEDLETAEPLYEQVVTLARELGDREITAVGLLNLAMVSLGRSSSERARLILIEALAIAEETGSRPAAQSVLEVCSALAAQREQWTQAARFYGAAEAQIESTGMQRDPTDEAFLQPFIAKSRDAIGAASFTTASGAGRALPLAEALSETRAWLENAAG